jgi:hypothetical protein
MSDISIDEKRVYADRAGKTEVFVAAGMGLARVDVSGDKVGGFGLDWRGDARDVAGGNGRLLVATDADVLVATDDGFAETGFGPATAVGVSPDGFLAAGKGRVARYDEGWESIGEATDVRAIDGDLLATGDGVRRVTADGLADAGLDDVRDVAGVGTPLAATPDALYELGNGWMHALGGDFEVCASDGERAHAATAGTLYGRDGTEWQAVDLPVETAIADVAYGEGTYAVGADGTFLVDAGDGFRDRSLGVRAARAVAVPGR